MGIHFAKVRGGRVRPPFHLRKGLNGASNTVRYGFWLLAAIITCLYLLNAVRAPGQNVFRRQRSVAPQRPPVYRPNNRPRAQRAPQDQAAKDLLKKMIHPAVNYTGEQVTEAGGQISRQKIEGEANSGRIRRDFLAPPALAGDIMLTGPNNYRYWHSKKAVLDMAGPWPTPWNERENRVLNAINARQLAVSMTGQEMVAGVNASIVVLEPNPANPGGNANRFQMKYWIDPASGVQLKVEISNASGVVSRSYMTSVTIGAPGIVSPQDFNPPQLQNVTPNVLFPTPQFGNMEEARASGKLPFTPLEPASLPMGFHLTGVWVFGGARKPGNRAVLLRYSDGVANFSLWEHPAANGVKPEPVRPAMYRRSTQQWRLPVSSSNLSVLYIGHLSPDQARLIHDSLH